MDGSIHALYRSMPILAWTCIISRPKISARQKHPMLLGAVPSRGVHPPRSALKTTVFTFIEVYMYHGSAGEKPGHLLPNRFALPETCAAAIVLSCAAAVA